MLKTRLKNDAFRRGSPDQALAIAGAGPQIVALVFVSIALIVLSRLDHSLIRSMRVTLTDLIAPALSATAAVLAPAQRVVRRAADIADLQSELTRLRDENQELRGWEGRARELERRFGALETLAKTLPDQRFGFVTTRVIAGGGHDLQRGALLDAGTSGGIATGQPVVNADGLVGRVLSTGSRASRLLLLTDINSRVPIQIGPSGIRALMAGDTGPLPKLELLQSDAKLENKIAAGDEVTTSGVGGLFPRGLRIGVVIDTGDSLRVEPYVRFEQLEYVSVLQFINPGTALAAEERAADPPQPVRRARAGRTDQPPADAPRKGGQP